MEKRKRDYLGAKIYDVPTQGYGSELIMEEIAIGDSPEPELVYKSPSPNETGNNVVLFGKGCSANGCPLVIPLDIPLPEALAAFYKHNKADHDELYPQRMIFLYRESPADPGLGTDGEGVVK